MCAAVLPGQPGESGHASLKDVVIGLSELHDLSQKSMEKIFRALWPNEPVPRDMTELAKCLKGASVGFRRGRCRPAEKVLEKHGRWPRHTIVC